jgi:hypothetical protein
MGPDSSPNALGASAPRFRPAEHLSASACETVLFLPIPRSSSWSFAVATALTSDVHVSQQPDP